MAVDRLAPIVRPDVGFVLVGEWTLDTPDRQRAAADAALDAWGRVAWPAGLLSHSCLLGTDDSVVLQYMQWTSTDACRAFVASDRSAWRRAVDSAVPGIERQGVAGYEPPRHRVDAEDQVPGCVVAVTREFDGPDLERARRWVDAIFDVPGGGEPVPGLISAHFHIAVDGARVLNVAQWTTEQAHRAMADGAAQRIEADAAMRRVERWPGLERTSFERYRPHRSVGAPTVE